MLLAVIVIAVVGISLSAAIGNVATQTYHLERRTLANWVAQNELTRLRLELKTNPRTLPEGKDNSRFFMSQREWVVFTEVIATDHPALRRIEIEVFESVDGENQGPLDHLVAFAGSQ